MTFLAGLVLIVLILFLIPKYAIKQEKERSEKSELIRRVNYLEKETKRQEALIKGECPDCNVVRKEGELICSQCQFEFFEGDYCDGCFDFFKSEDLSVRRDIDLNRIYECKNCLNQISRRSPFSPNFLKEIKLKREGSNK